MKNNWLGFELLGLDFESRLRQSAQDGCLDLPRETITNDADQRSGNDDDVGLQSFLTSQRHQVTCTEEKFQHLDQRRREDRKRR